MEQFWWSTSSCPIVRS
uniref:Uncharacterized protein n=1 Tax=Anguilla anguilla TaxID=7936 RepID=A0A0E9PW72_ANGAN